MRAFWEETGIELTASCTRLCWELLPRGVFRRRERGTISHTITFLDDMAVHVPMLDAWDQFVWLPSAAVPRATTEVEQYGYHRGNAMDRGAVTPATEFRVTNKEGAYLCAARGLIFKENVLAYNPASWAEERTVVMLANFVPRIP